MTDPISRVEAAAKLLSKTACSGYVDADLARELARELVEAKRIAEFVQKQHGTCEICHCNAWSEPDEKGVEHCLLCEANLKLAKTRYDALTEADKLITHESGWIYLTEIHAKLMAIRDGNQDKEANTDQAQGPGHEYAHIQRDGGGRVHKEMVEAGFTEAQCYAVLVERIEASINQWRGLAHEAYKTGDNVGVWEAGQQIKELERQRDTMRKPSAA